MWKFFSNLWGEFFLADSGGKCLRDLFFRLYFNRINREQAKKDSQNSFQMWVDRKKFIQTNGHNSICQKYVEPISSSSSYEFIITLLYTPKQAFVKKCIHWFKVRVKLISKSIWKITLLWKNFCHQTFYNLRQKIPKLKIFRN